MKKKNYSFYLDYMRWIKTKTISRYCPFKGVNYNFFFNYTTFKKKCNMKMHF
jgi:hypothetical protein